jgi:hypothetical protein
MAHEHPDWPPQSTGAGLSLRLVHALGRPGRPRRAAIVLLGLGMLMVMFVVLLLVLSAS